MLSKIDGVMVDAIAKSHGFIGYWTSRNEEALRNKLAVSGRTKNKEKNKAILREMLKKIKSNDKNALKKLRNEATIKFECTDNNVRALIKEITEEENGNKTPLF